MPADPIYKRIGALIKARRKKLEMKQEVLASTLGISRGSLANIETGRQSILVHQLYKYADALQLAPSDLMPPRYTDQTSVNRTELPLPMDLKAQQKEQVKKLFLQVETKLNDKAEVRHAKNRKAQKSV